MAQWTESKRAALGTLAGARPRTTWRDDLITMTAAIWPITAMFFDGRGHNNQTGQESFFSVPHLVLYSGLMALSLWIAWVLVKHQHQAGADVRRGRVDFEAIPVGYGITVLGLGALGLGGPADLIWHSRFGFEVNVDAIYSPPHLLLFFGGLLVASTGIRAMWAKEGTAPEFVRFVPVALSSVLFIGVLGFITMYLSAYMTNVSPTRDFMANIERLNDVRFDPTISLNAGLTHYGDDKWAYYFYSASHGMASMIVTTAVLLGPILVLLRRWRPPFGAVTLIYFAFGLLVNIMTDYRDIVLLVSLLVAGATVDLLVPRLRPPRYASLGGIRVIGTATAATLWISYYAVLALHKGIGWGGALWVGALMIGVMTGLGLGLLVAPPAISTPAPGDGAIAP